MVRFLIMVTFWGVAPIRRWCTWEGGVYSNLSDNDTTLIRERSLFETRRLLEERGYCFYSALPLLKESKENMKVKTKHRSLVWHDTTLKFFVYLFFVTKVFFRFINIYSLNWNHLPHIIELSLKSDREW